MSIMQKFKMRLTSFLLIMTCVMLLFVAIYERNCSNALRATSISVSDPDVRALLADELKLMERESELQSEMARFEQKKITLPFDAENLDTSIRKDLANFRNSKLKLIRERHILNAIRMDLTQRSKK